MDKFEAAANWWADKIANPVFDNGDETENGAMGQVLATALTDTTTEQQLTIFKKELVKILKANAVHFDFWFGVDYGPDNILGAAMDAANIKRTNAPWKTNMVIKGDFVKASSGYGAEFEVVF